MLHKPVNHEHRRSRSKSPSTRTRSRSLSLAAKRLSLRTRPEELQDTYGKRDSLLPESLYDTHCEQQPLEAQSAIFMNDHGTQGRGQNNRHSTGPEIYGLPEVSKYSTYKPVPRSPIKDKSQEGAGASFEIGLGGHNLSGGIHLSKSKPLKRFSKSESSNSFSPKNLRDNPLAYGKFGVDHLAYPDLPKSRNLVDVPRQETSRLRPTSVLYDSPSAFPMKPDQRYDAIISPPELSQSMHSLQINDKHQFGIGTGTSLSSAPGSPLLESYRGTYQSISPMPSPLLKAMHHISSPNTDINYYYSSADERNSCSNSREFRRTARFHDPEEEAKLLAKALRGETRLPDTIPLISILPGLTHIQILELRSQYKKLVRTVRDKKGVNLAKHIKLRLKSQPDLMKACYVCALGQWESEAYWANYWYQSQKSQRELLIESLMGRTNEEIRLIKEGFRDKKYHNSLTRCLQTELREDKFKKAVMLVLEEKQMEESLDGSVDKDLVASDVVELRDAVKQKRGGETAVLKIILLRSKTHLRELLKAYNLMYERNFAKEILQKSENLVGELLAHILNGVINAPHRDALLLKHALNLPRIDNSWCDLLISRLIRYHWDRPHFERIRSEFRHLYNIELQTAVSESVSGDLGLFLEALCVRRTEGDVRVLPSS